VDDLIAALSNRLQRFGESRDPSVVLEWRAIEEANALWNAARPKRGESPAITQALVVLAYLYWARYRVLPSGEDQDDLRAGLCKLGSGALAIAQTLTRRSTPDARPWQMIRMLVPTSLSFLVGLCNALRMRFELVGDRVKLDRP
jgi:hypothetical protein